MKHHPIASVGTGNCRLCYPRLGGSLTPWAAPLATFPLYGLTLFIKWASQLAHRYVREYRAVVSGGLGLLLGPGRRGTSNFVICEMVCPRVKVSMDFPGFLFWKRAGYMCFNPLKSLGCPEFKNSVPWGETAPQWDNDSGSSTCLCSQDAAAGPSQQQDNPLGASFALQLCQFVTLGVIGRNMAQGAGWH